MTITDRVRNLLNYSKKARNSDKELYILYMQRSGMNLTKEQIALIWDMPSFETIRRIRQKIQEGGELVADSDVAKERKFKAMEMEQNTPTAKPERVEQILSDGTKLKVPSGYVIRED